LHAPDLAAKKERQARVFAVGDVAALAAMLNGIVRSPPTPAMIQAKSEAYSFGAAVGGIEAAITMIARTRGCGVCSAPLLRGELNSID